MQSVKSELLWGAILTLAVGVFALHETYQYKLQVLSFTVQAQGQQAASPGSAIDPLKPAPPATAPANQQPSTPNAPSVTPPTTQPSSSPSARTTPIPSPAPKPSAAPPPTPSSNVTLTAAEVAKHATPQNCWVIISGSVYNVTSYIPFHPGGASRITPYCGKDATQAFATKGGEGTHSSAASQQLASLLVGKLGASVTASLEAQAQTNPSNGQTTNPPAPTGGGGEYEYEDD